MKEFIRRYKIHARICHKTSVIDFIKKTEEELDKEKQEAEQIWNEHRIDTSYQWKYPPKNLIN